MKPFKPHRSKVFFFFWLFLIFSTAAFSATINIQPGDSIQAAIDSASNGDIIILANGTYTGSGNYNIAFKGKAITVKSANGATNSIIDCQKNSRGFKFTTDVGNDSVLDGVTIINGSHSNDGGGILCKGASPLIKNCIIRDCNANYGGGIVCDNSSPLIANCIIEKNSTINSNGAGLYFNNNSNPIVTNCIINNNNTNSYGGGIYCSSNSAPQITNCTLYNNTANSGGDNVRIVSPSEPQFTNCIIWGTSSAQISSSTSSPTFNYCNIRGGYSGTGNINSNPLFVNSTDLHLTENSPCIDAGTLNGAPLIDFDKDSRPQGDGIDIGADEFAYSDVDNDGIPDKLEDINSNNIVDFSETDPNNPDTDGDGLMDGYEANSCFDPLVEDNVDSEDKDNDGLSNIKEFRLGINPCESDTDGDGINDKIEVDFGLDPKQPEIFVGQNGSIQDAIDQASDGDTVVVGEGTFTGAGNYNIRFNGKGITVKSINGPQNTIIDCLGDGRAFLFSDGETSSSILKGFTIENSDTTGDGAGIYCSGSSPIIENCIIKNCHTSSNGGAIGALNNANPSIVNCFIYNNSANSDGGGLFAAESSDPLIINCTFNGNSANRDGQTVRLYKKCKPKFQNTIIWGSSSDQISLYSSMIYKSEPKFSNCNIRGGYDGTANINSDPLFDSNDGFKLTEGSPCIDNGSTMIDYPEVDIQGDFRPQRNGVDIGADEYFIDTDRDHISDLIEDPNQNGIVDLYETDPNNPDSDGDGILDGIEDSNQNGTKEETETDPLSQDTDSDGIYDGIEDSNHNGVKEVQETSPISSDTDGDGISDGIEDSNHNGVKEVQETSPISSDTDGDGISDGLEDSNQNGVKDESEMDPLSIDTDNDNILDRVEDANLNGMKDENETNPTLSDTDGDGINDGIEDSNHNGSKDIDETNPLKIDTDEDGLSDGIEDTNKNGVKDVDETDPLLMDTDSDNLADGAEDSNKDGIKDSTETDPRYADTDNDGMPDGWELEHDLSPLVNDAIQDKDNDGLTNLQEFQLGLLPNNPDTDGDTLSDGWEVENGTIPNSSDADGDGIDDGKEIEYGLDPNSHTIYIRTTDTIQAKIDSPEVQSGNILYIEEGVYKGPGNYNISFHGKFITLKSIKGPEKTIIDCENLGRGFIFNSRENSSTVLDGVSIINGSVNGDGGGIYFDEASPIIKNCIISDSRAISGDGGGIYFKTEPAYIESKPILENCVIRNNIAGNNGGAVYCGQYTSAQLINCTIINNSTSSNQNSIHFYKKCKPKFKNCIFWGSSSNQFTKDSTWFSKPDPLFEFCNIKGGTGGYDATGNINSDPLFINDTSWVLSENSPCVDAGIPEGSPQNDITGDYRPQGSGFDIGADEYLPAVDADGDGLQDGWELTHFGMLTQEGDDDPDNDGISNLEEMQAGTLPTIGYNLTVKVDDWVIQEAIDRINEGGTIIVEAGVYKGTGNKDIDLNGKNLTLKSLNGPAATIINCENNGRGFYFHSNESQETIIDGFTIKNGYDGGIYSNNASPVIKNCILEENSDAAGAGISCFNDSNPKIINCIIKNNNATIRGGGIYLNNSSPEIINCTLNGNVAGETGHGIQCSNNAAPTITNCIIWGDSINQIARSESSPVVNFCNIKGGDIPGTGNINSDPLFMQGGNLRISGDSPCIDAGTIEIALEKDIDGDNRHQGDSVDIGADEFDILLDNDNDQLPDYWEGKNFGTLNLEPEDDPDNDGISNIDEMNIGSCPSCGLNLTVAVDAWNIQEAVYRVDEGGIVNVQAGTYNGRGNKNIDFNGKKMTLKSISGPGQTIIDCEGDGRGFEFNKNETTDSIVDGFTIKNGSTGALYFDNSSPFIKNLIIADNIGEKGGGISCYTASPVFVNLVVRNNTAEEGGGIYCADGASPVFTNCTINNNDSNRDYGHSLRCYKSCDPVFKNSILWGADSGQISLYNFNDKEKYDSHPKFSHCNIRGGYSGPGNLSSNPEFTDVVTLKLTEDSPCVDSGVIDGAPENDIEGDTRPQGITIDIGADECVFTSDVDADTLIDKWELMTFSSMNQEGNDDPDNDGFSNYQEMVAGTCPNCGPNLTVYIDDWDIQGAVDKVDPTGIVTIGDGTYIGSKNKNINFGGKDITLKSINGPEVTIIDCQQSGRGFIFNNGETAASLLSGFSIVNGSVEGEGAGIKCSNSSPIITNCIIDNSQAKKANYPNIEDSNGGGISITGSTAKINRCLIKNCYATDNGGGISIENSAAELSQCVIQVCNAYDNGGGLFINNSSPLLSRCIIKNNISGDGCGIYTDKSNSEIINTIIVGNSNQGAETKNDYFGDFGGAIFGTGYSSLNVINCTLVNNSCGNNGGIYLTQSTNLTVKNSIICNNSGSDQIVKFGYTSSHEVTYSIVKKTADLKFYSDIDFHIWPDSPCVNTGTLDGAPLIDADGLARPQWEQVDIGAYECDLNIDSDSDGLLDALEIKMCTKWNDDDSDNDGLKDGDEDIANVGIVDQGETDPCDSDTDDDNLSDGAEVNVYGTDPTLQDTDKDRMPDGWEIENSTELCTINPLDPNDAKEDCDNDTFSNIVEFLLNTDPQLQSEIPAPGNYYQYDAIGRIKSIIRIN